MVNGLTAKNGIQNASTPLPQPSHQRPPFISPSLSSHQGLAVVEPAAAVVEEDEVSVRDSRLVPRLQETALGAQKKRPHCDRVRTG